MCGCIECIGDQPEPANEGFYEKLWKDFVSLQRGDAALICRDAERYRWLRDSDFDIFGSPHAIALEGDSLDKAIDAAMGQTPNC